MKGIAMASADRVSLPVEDEDQILATIHRNPAAFEALYERYLSRVYRYLYARVGSAVEAEDLTSQVFLAAYESLPRYRHQGQFAAWLFSIARCKAADYHRAGDARRLVALDEKTSFSPDPLAALAAEDDLRRSAVLLARLDEDERELLRLRFAAGLSFEAIGRVLRRSTSAVKMAIYRLLDRLQEQMEVGHE